MIGKALLGLCATLLVAGTAAAGEQSNKDGLKKNDPSRVVCRTSSDTGSRLGRTKVCRTNAEWEELRRQTQQAVDKAQNRRSGSNQ